MHDDWRRELAEQWAVTRDKAVREWILAAYEDKLARLTEAEQSELFERLADL
jgi:hypothetical protein